MAASQKPARPLPATDSPWFWVFLFGSAGLLLLAVIEPKFAARQERIERMQQTRQRVAAQGTADEPDRAAGEAWERGAIRRRPLRWLMLAMAALLFMAVLCHSMFRLRRVARADSEPPLDETMRIPPPTHHPEHGGNEG